VLSEVKNLNVSIYERLRELMKDPSNKFISFTNEHHREAYVERQKVETSNNFNDRAIRSCCTWYSRHSEQSDIKVLLFTNDLDCKKKAPQEGLISFTLQEYVDLLTEAPDLQDLLLAPAESCEAESVQHADYLPKH
jgi:exosome complex exonuclease DIS3/RRP44